MQKGCLVPCIHRPDWQGVAKVLSKLSQIVWQSVGSAAWQNFFWQHAVKFCRLWKIEGSSNIHLLVFIPGICCDQSWLAFLYSIKIMWNWAVVSHAAMHLQDSLMTKCLMQSTVHNVIVWFVLTWNMNFLLNVLVTTCKCSKMFSHPLSFLFPCPFDL